MLNTGTIIPLDVLGEQYAGRTMKITALGQEPLNSIAHQFYEVRRQHREAVSKFLMGLRNFRLEEQEEHENIIADCNRVIAAIKHEEELREKLGKLPLEKKLFDCEFEVTSGNSMPLKQVCIAWESTDGISFQDLLDRAGYAGGLDSVYLTFFNGDADRLWKQYEGTFILDSTGTVYVPNIITKTISLPERKPALEHYS